MKSTSMNNHIHHHKDQHGLTLIEVMISITISLILLAGVMQIFTSSRQTYAVQDNMARLQENGRFAMSFLNRDVRAADYWGCLPNTATIANNLTGAPPGLGNVAGIAGTDGGTDTITLGMAIPSGITLQAPFMPSPAAVIQTSPSTLRRNDIVIISNCTNGDIFQITNANPGPANGIVGHISGAGVPGNTFNNPGVGCPGGATNCLSSTYGADAQLMSAQTITYSIANDVANNNEPTLFQSVNGGAAVALVEGVEDMQILYGEDTDMVFPPPALPLPNGDSSANRYVAFGTAGLDMRRVVSVRIGLVLRTKENNLATSVQSFNFNGAVVVPADRRLRRVFSTTIGLRNRGA